METGGLQRPVGACGLSWLLVGDEGVDKKMEATIRFRVVSRELRSASPL